MCRSMIVSVGFFVFTTAVSGQTPLFPRSPAKISGVRAAPTNEQFVGYVGQPVPMPTNPTAPMSTPMGPMGIPSATQPSTTLGQPKEIVGTPTVTEQRGSMIPGTPGMTGMSAAGISNGQIIYDPVMSPGMISGGVPPQGGYGVPNICDGPFTYLNDGPMGGAVSTGSSGGLLTGRPILGRFAQPGKWYGSAEYLLWYVNGNRLPPLLTTSAAADNGFLGAATTRTLFGGDDFTANQRNGGRFIVGYWFGCDQQWGIDTTYFFLGSRNDSFTVASEGNPLLARPFLNANTNQQFSQIIAYPGQSSGVFTAQQESSLWGADINLRRFVSGSACRRFDILAGFKYLNLEESLAIREDVNRLNGGFPGILPNVGSAIVTDSFQTSNQFYGGQIGMIGEMRRGRWFLDGNVKVGLGVMNQSLRIDGSQTVTTANGTVTTEGGLLALPNANIGSYSQNKFAVVPEAGLNLGYHVTPNCRVFVGYTILYASSVLRPGEQIDTTIDVTRIPNFPTTATRLSTVHPAPILKTTDFTAQGLSIGVQFKW